jgi:tricorn protease
MRRILLALFVAAAGLAPAAVTAQPDTTDTRLLAMPAISARQIAFVYADDLWVADRDGKNARRLTSDIDRADLYSPESARELPPLAASR